MDNKKYPTSLFIIGFFTNIFLRFSWLFILSVILLITGIFFAPCLCAGLAVLLVDIVLSLIDQLRIRRTFLTENDSPDFREFQDALSKEGNLKDNIDDYLAEKISDDQNKIKTDNESED